MNTKICAIVVTYKSNPKVIELLSSLLAHVSYIYIIDNGSDYRVIKILQEFIAKNYKAISLTCNNSNLGIATAQNQGIRQALGADFDWVMLMDDDSLPEENMVQEMLSEWEKQGDAKIGIISPRLQEQNISVASHHLVPCCKIGFKRKIINSGENLLNAVTVISSGSIVSRYLFQKIGLMREGFFIDYVDHEFCLRAYANGYKIMVVGNAVLRHKQGNKRYEKLGRFEIKTLNYNPLRYYYIFRNRIFFLRLYGIRFPFIIAHELFACALDIFRVISRENYKLAKLKSIFTGLKDGISKPIPAITH